ncbi:MAG: sigma-70 family RNA polymerase sigma factor [Candidatus Latescibacteria bacterium]|nr:sigma-70 family RNA polymerase sigma factor [Candidatus Latescibacterota bacterium]
MEWDEATLAALIREHRPLVKKTLRYFVEDAEELADLEQETFLRALVFLPSLRQADLFGAWICAIARRLALGRFRVTQREQEHLRAWAVEAAALETQSIGEVGVIESALQQLPAPVTQILRLGYFEELDSRGIAQRLGISEANARQQLSRGRAKLKEVIMDTIRQDQELAEVLVQRLLHTARTLTEQGKYQEAVGKFLEAFNEFPSSLTALSRLPEELRTALHQAWGETYQYHPPDAFD